MLVANPVLPFHKEIPNPILDGLIGGFLRFDLRLGFSEPNCETNKSCKKGSAVFDVGHDNERIMAEFRI